MVVTRCCGDLNTQRKAVPVQSQRYLGHRKLTDVEDRGVLVVWLHEHLADKRPAMTGRCSSERWIQQNAILAKLFDELFTQYATLVGEVFLECRRA